MLHAGHLFFLGKTFTSPLLESILYRPPFGNAVWESQTLRLELMVYLILAGIAGLAALCLLFSLVVVAVKAFFVVLSVLLVIAAFLLLGVVFW